VSATLSIPCLATLTSHFTELYLKTRSTISDRVTKILYMKPGLLLIGHGTRDPRGSAEFLQLSQLVQSVLPAEAVTGCFLELAEPGIEQGIQQLLDQGVEHIVIAPLLLFAAGHAKRDVPEAVAQAIQQHPQLKLSWLPAFGCHPTILSLSEQRLQSACAVTTADHPQHRPVADRCLLMVGRGSSDPQATAALREFTARRAARAQVATAVSCFVAVQKPNLSQGLQLASQLPHRQIIVQPHLLFHGLLWQEILTAVKSQAALSPHQEWWIAPYLGPAPELAQVIVEYFFRMTTA
jgi:sirohydrochlorin cobaltochelatase